MNINELGNGLALLRDRVESERDLSDSDTGNILELIETTRQNFNEGLDLVVTAIKRSAASRDQALVALIESPAPVQFKQAAE